MAKKKNRITKSGLTPLREEFCRIYATSQEYFGNGVMSYLQATKKIKQGRLVTYAAAKASAWELLTNPDVLKRIDYYLDLYVNDQIVDKELAFVILQKADFSSKVAAIREYNNLKRRTKNPVTNQYNIINLTPERMKQLDDIAMEE